MSARKIVVIDCETGGLNPETDMIVSIGLVVLHGPGVDGQFYSTINDTQGNYGKEAAGLHLLSKDALIAEGSSVGDVVDRIEDFLQRHDFRDPRKVTLGGCQTSVDYGFLRRLYRLAGKEELFQKRYDRRLLDISHGALLLEQAGRLDLQCAAPSLENIARALGVNLKRENDRHDALDDALATAKVLGKMIDLLRFTGGNVGTDRAVSR